MFEGSFLYDSWLVDCCASSRQYHDIKIVIYWGSVQAILLFHSLGFLFKLSQNLLHYSLFFVFIDDVHCLSGVWLISARASYSNSCTTPCILLPLLSTQLITSYSKLLHTTLTISINVKWFRRICWWCCSVEGDFTCVSLRPSFLLSATIS